MQRQLVAQVRQLAVPAIGERVLVLDARGQVQEWREGVWRPLNVPAGVKRIAAGVNHTLLLLEDGRYEFTGRARTEGFGASDTTDTDGVILRISGEKTPKSSTSPEWTTLHYEFEVHGIVTTESS